MGVVGVFPSRVVDPRVGLTWSRTPVSYEMCLAWPVTCVTDPMSQPTGSKPPTMSFTAQPQAFRDLNLACDPSALHVQPPVGIRVFKSLKPHARFFFAATETRTDPKIIAIRKGLDGRRARAMGSGHAGRGNRQLERLPCMGPLECGHGLQRHRGLQIAISSSTHMCMRVLCVSVALEQAPLAALRAMNVQYRHIFSCDVDKAAKSVVLLNCHSVELQSCGCFFGSGFELTDSLHFVPSDFRRQTPALVRQPSWSGLGRGQAAAGLLRGWISMSKLQLSRQEKWARGQGESQSFVPCYKLVFFQTPANDSNRDDVGGMT